MTTTEEKLNRLASLQANIDALKLRYDQLRQDAIPDSVRALLQEIDAEQAEAVGPAMLEVEELKREIECDVLEGKASVKGTYLQAVYTQPKVTWETGLLAGFAIAHPEILSARKIGKPSVSFREVKNGRG